MRRAGKVDRNHAEIVKALRQTGASVLSLASVGKGCPDLLVGRCGINLLLEVKDGLATPPKRKLTAAEHKFHAEWAGHKEVVYNATDAVRVVLQGT